MPRKPISDKPMTPAERTRKHRAKIKAENPLDLKACLREITSLNKKIERQRLSNKRLSQENSKLRKEDNFWLGIKDDLSASLNATKQFSKEEIKLLKQVCHPDKHNQSEAATRAIALLNKLKY